MEKKRASAISIMGRLIVLVKPLTMIMLLGITLGTLGHLCAIFISVLAGKAVSMVVLAASGASGVAVGYKKILIALVIIAILRGILHYGEQYCNHYIAFRILAIIRHKVFSALRKLCPAKLEGKDKGDLISVITSDIELLEVFFAHTISPIAIAVLTSLIMVIYIGKQYLPAGVLALIGFILVGAVIPVLNEKRSADRGLEFRNGFAALGSFVLGLMYGLDETLQYDTGKKSLKDIQDRSEKLSDTQKDLSAYEKTQKLMTNFVIQLIDWSVLVVMVIAYINGKIELEGMLTGIFAMMSSFGPVVALASLSNNLNQTLASGERVLALLDEKPVVEEVTGKKELEISGNTLINVDNITFSYNDGVNNDILKDFSAKIYRGKILGIHGASGSGKSTLLRLIMRFWDVEKGEISFTDEKTSVKDINTASLRKNESFVTQETWVFHDTIGKNIAVAKQNATKNEIIEAAKKASIHDFIETLPDKYDTKVGELGDTLSGGEKQRIGLARAFLHDGDIMLLDEPTSSLDSLNEGIILKALKEERKDKTVILVSHRQSTMGVVDAVLEM
ncbi:MAG: ABC transporter ATP-binding protein [Butyrivibrio sp.]|nr:ABC transporter ATP-binding protein [Butyrivibrio sp.]